MKEKLRDAGGRRIYSQEERLRIIQEAEKTGNFSQTARKHGISTAMLFMWRKKYVGVPETKEPKPAAAPAFFAPLARRPSNDKDYIAQLERLVFQQAYEIHMLKNKD